MVDRYIIITIREELMVQTHSRTPQDYTQWVSMLLAHTASYGVVTMLSQQVGVRRVVRSRTGTVSCTPTWRSIVASRQEGRDTLLPSARVWPGEVVRGVRKPGSRVSRARKCEYLQLEETQAGELLAKRVCAPGVIDASTVTP